MHTRKDQSFLWTMTIGEAYGLLLRRMTSVFSIFMSCSFTAWYWRGGIFRWGSRNGCSSISGIVCFIVEVRPKSSESTENTSLNSWMIWSSCFIWASSSMVDLGRSSVGITSITFSFAPMFLPWTGGQPPSGWSEVDNAAFVAVVDFKLSSTWSTEETWAIRQFLGSWDDNGFCRDVAHPYRHSSVFTNISDEVANSQTGGAFHESCVWMTCWVRPWHMMSSSAPGWSFRGQRPMYLAKPKLVAVFCGLDAASVLCCLGCVFGAGGQGAYWGCDCFWRGLRWRSLGVYFRM